MKEPKKNQNKPNDDAAPSDAQSTSRREFLKKSGIYGAATPVALATLMSPGKSHAVSSDGGP